MLTQIKFRLSAFINRIRRSRGPAFRDQCVKVIMQMCALQMERGEYRELARTEGAVGTMRLSGGAITTVEYSVFDKEADRVDGTIKNEPWRAFSKVTMRVTIDKDPEFDVTVEGIDIEPRSCHKDPGIALIRHLSNYFPLIPKLYQGAVYKPEIPA